MARKGHGRPRLAVALVSLGLVGALLVDPTPPPAGAQVTCFGQVPTIYAQPGRVTVGTEGPDVIYGTSGPDVIRGRGGNDRICSRGGRDLVHGNKGADRIDLGFGADTGHGGKGDDLIRGKSGIDLLEGNSGEDTLIGGGGNDQIFGGRHDDTLRGKDGNDLLVGNSGEDLLLGGRGIDVCRGGPDDDSSSSCNEPSARFTTLPPGSRLPSGAACAERVRSAPEIRPRNTPYNQTRGTSPHDDNPRVDGDFVGTTDEIIQWAACKHGIDEDLVRAQMAIESWWYQDARGNTTSDQSECHPALRGGAVCPESIGIGQVRYQYHLGAFEDSNAINSTAYNVDYTYDTWRECYEGELGWLNTVERGRDYARGDMLGCLGVWFAGRWYTGDAVWYMDQVQDYLDTRVWETDAFLAG